MKPQKSSRRPLVTAQQVADHIGVHKATVYRMVTEGLIPCVRAGRAIRFDLDSVLHALAHNELDVDVACRIIANDDNLFDSFMEKVLTEHENAAKQAQEMD